MSIPNPSQGIAISQQAAQGFISLPWAKLPITIFTGFSSDLVAAAKRDPFVYRQSPFDIDALSAQKFIYSHQDNCRGSFSSSSTTADSHFTDHTSVALGVSVGNEYLNAGVTGTYDKAVLEDRAISKSSIKCTFMCGSVRPFLTPPLSGSAIAVLREGGLEAFQAVYGDYYVNAFSIGGDSAVLISTSSLDTSITENAKVVGKVQILCWEDEETLLDIAAFEESKHIRFAVTAFDTLTDLFINIPGTDDASRGLTVSETKALAGRYGALTRELPERIMKPMKALEASLKSGTGEMTFGWDSVRTVVESGLVMQVVLVPFARMREVMEVVKSAATDNKSPGVES